jgi:hypothetical protein
MEMKIARQRPTATDLHRQHIEHRLPFADAVTLMNAAPLLLAALADVEKDLACLLARLQDVIAKATEIKNGGAA